MFRMNQILVLVSLLIMVSGCESDSMFDDLNKAQQKFEQEVKENDISRWSIEVMFPDEQIQLLAKAAGKGQIERVRTLVAHGADVNYRGKNGIVPLAWTLRKKNIDGFKALVQLGAETDVYWTGGGSKTPIDWSIELSRSSDERFLRYLLENGANPNFIGGGSHKITPIYIVVGIGNEKNDIATLRLLKKSGADINYIPPDKNTPLHEAYFTSIGINRVNFEIFKELIKLGAVPSLKVKNDLGLSVIDYILRDEKRYSKSTSKRDQEKYSRITDLINWMENRGIRVKS